MTLLIVGIILFIGTHMLRVVAPGLRATVIARFGKPVWIAGYAVLSLVTLVLLVYGYGQARQVTGMLYTPPVWLAHITLTLMLLASICLVAGFLPAGHIATKTRHPVVLAVKIWAFSHLLANGETSSVILFGAFLAWAVVMRIVMKRRARAGEITPRAFVSARYDLFSVVIGIILWAAMIWKLHEWLIGVAPIVMG